MANLKLAVGLNNFFLTFVGMLLTGLLVLVFWYGDVVTRESRGLERQLRLLAESIVEGNKYTGTGLNRLAQEVKAGYVVNTATPEGLSTGEAYPEQLEILVTQAKETGSGFHDVSGVIPPLPVGSGFAYITVGAADTAGKPIALGIAVPQQYFTDKIWSKQKTIFVYLLVNCVILTVISFFRFFTTVLRPIDRLIQLADTYEGGEFDLPAKKDCGEIGQLSTAVRTMLSRINEDRDKLRDNISQLEQANLELEKSRREMVRAEKMAVTGRIAAGLGHEIGNPIGIISGYLELVKKVEIPQSEKVQYLARAESELERVHALVRQLVDCGRRSCGPLYSFDAYPVIESVVAMMEHNKQAGNITFLLKCEAVDTIIVAQPDNLKQVLLNCLFNAVDAIREVGKRYKGCIQVLIENTAHDGERYLRLAVIDNGAGLATEKQQELFEPFFSTKAPGVGTGLGLTVSQSLVEGFNGKMKFESKAGQGAVMYIYIPLSLQAQKNGEKTNDPS